MNGRHSAEDVSVARATIASVYERQWRYWRAFVAEQRDEFQRRQADAGGFTDAFGASLTATSAPVKANLPGDVRQELMRVLELRRQESLAAAEEHARKQGDGAPDRDAVYLALLDHIDAELAGERHPRGLANVWYGGQLQEFNHRHLLSQTTAADYAAHFGADHAKKRRAIMLLIGSGVAIVLVVAILIISSLGSDSTTATAAPRVAQVSGAAVPLWDVTQLGVDGTQYTVPFARTGYPLLLCAPPASKPAITPGATLVLTGTTSVRSYQVQPANATTGDLVVADCTQTPPATIGRAQLMSALTSTALDPTHLTAVAVDGPDIDPATIPTDRMRVALTLDSTVGRDGTLVLVDGSRIAPAQTVPISQGVTLIYLVPLTNAPQPAGWEVSKATGIPAVLPLTLPAPQSRAQLLRDGLSVQPGAVHVERQNNALVAVIPLTLHNTTNQPLTLRASDLLALQGSTVLETPQWTPPVIRAGQAVTITVRTAVHSQAQSLELALAGWHARLSWQL